MNVKTGVQTWSKTPQPGIQKSDNTHFNSAHDEAKLGEDIGTILNKVADPNYVDPSKKMRTVGNPELGKDAFMNLLITQMKHQDPTSPLKSHEMAAQLAQFTSLEKLTNIDAGIEKMRGEAKPDRNFEALTLIGKNVTTDSSKISRLDQKSMHDLRFRLAADAISTKVTIKDAKGNAIRELTFNNLKKGKNDLTWNGQLEDGTAAPVGEYFIDVEARGSNGNKIFSEFKSNGRITGVNFTARGPQVMVGRDAIDLADVKSITEASPTDQEDKPIFAGQSIPLPGQGTAAPAAAPAGPVMPAGMMPLPKKTMQKAEVKPQTISKADSAKRAKLAEGSINDANIARELEKRLEKEGVTG